MKLCLPWNMLSVDGFNFVFNPGKKKQKKKKAA